MNAFLLLIILTFLFGILVFMPDLLPKCDNCGMLKTRPFFKIHKTVRVCLGYSSVTSVCKTCCRKYGINDYEEYLRLVHSKKVAKINSIKLLRKY